MLSTQEKGFEFQSGRLRPDSDGQFLLETGQKNRFSPAVTFNSWDEVTRFFSKLAYSFSAIAQSSPPFKAELERLLPPDKDGMLRDPRHWLDANENPNAVHNKKWDTLDAHFRGESFEGAIGNERIRIEEQQGEIKILGSNSTPPLWTPSDVITICAQVLAHTRNQTGQCSYLWSPFLLAGLLGERPANVVTPTPDAAAPKVVADNQIKPEAPQVISLSDNQFGSRRSEYAQHLLDQGAQILLKYGF